MKYLLFFFAIFLGFVPITAGAAQQVVCDEETGICRLVEVPDIPAEAAVTQEQPVPAKAEKWQLLRRQIGDPGKEKLLAFLKGGNAADSNDIGFWGMLLLALLGGMALNLTPCVLPMLPINLAIIGATGGKTGFRRGLLYGIGMAVIYGVLGILAAFAGLSFGTLNSSPLFNFAIALLFVIMSLAMAGVFNIDIAAKFRLNPAKLNLSRDMAALFMGGVSALLAGACVAPVVISVLIFAASANWYGAFVPLALGVGMGLPWPLAGAGLAVLPKPGRFMVAVKYIFALIIFAAAVYYLHLGIRLLPTGDMAAEIDGFAALQAAKEESLKSGKPVLVKFTASWCKNCHAMERTTLRDPEVAEFIRENFIVATFPAEDPQQPDIAALLEEYEIPGFPALVILKAAEP